MALIAKRHWRGFILKQKISKNKKRWIFELGTLTPQDLNIDLYLNHCIGNVIEMGENTQAKLLQVSD